MIASETKMIEEIEVPARSIELLREFEADEYTRTRDLLAAGRELLAGRAVHNVSVSATDGVAAMIRSLLGLARGSGLNVRWSVAEIDAGSRVLGRRLYNNLYGLPGDGGVLDAPERSRLEETGALAARELMAVVKPDDVVIVHAPILGGMVPALREAGPRIVWRAHLGVDEPNALVRRAWDFLCPYVSSANACVYSSSQFAWQCEDSPPVYEVGPSIDPLSPKNQDLDDATVQAILGELGLAGDGNGYGAVFTRFDGSPARVTRMAAIDQDEPVPPDALVAAQVSGWERVKDQAGLLQAFARADSDEDVHLVIAGPHIGGRQEGSEESAVFDELRVIRRSLEPGTARRIHLVQIPTDDLDENAVAVNAIQRRAQMVVHKSHQEGFGLSVTEAMWKRRPVIAASVGGIGEQLTDGETGILIDDPADLDALGKAITLLAGDPELRRRLGEEARRHVSRRYLPLRHLASYMSLVSNVLED